MAKILCLLFGSGYHIDVSTGAVSSCIDFNWWHFAFFLVVFYVGANVLITAFWGEDEESPKEDWNLFWEWANLDESKASFDKWNDGRTMMTYQGDKGTFHFLFWRDSKGQAVMQQTDRSGNYYRQEVRGAPNAWRFGSNPDESLLDYVRYIINTGAR